MSAPLRAAFSDMGDALVSLVAGISESEYELPSIGDWTVRELIAHTIRAYSLIGTYLDGPVVEGSCATAGEYFRRALVDPATHIQIAERGRQSGIQLTDPVAQTTAAVMDGVRRTSQVDDLTLMSSFMGQIPFGEYLRTRLVEATLHSLDLIAALGREISLPSDAVRLTLDTLLDTASVPVLTLIAQSVSGRATLPSGFNLIQ